MEGTLILDKDDREDGEDMSLLASDSSLAESLALDLRDFSSWRFLFPSLVKAEPVLRAFSKSSITLDSVLASGSGLS